VELRPDAPPELQSIVERALAKDPRARYPDCRALQTDLERCLMRLGQPVRAVDIAALVERYFPKLEIPSEAEEATVPVVLRELREPETVVDAPVEPPAAQPPMNPRWVVGGYALAAFVATVSIGYLLQRPARPPPVVEAPKPTVAPPEPKPLPPIVAPPPAPTPAGPIVAAPPAVAAPEPPKSPRVAKVHRARQEPSSPPAVAAPPPAPTPAAAAPGKLAVHVQPWADVVIDGHDYGVTPLAPISLLAGNHEVRLRNDELHVDRTVVVTVRGGEQGTIKVNLAE
jgi:hypothetical protein